MPRVGIIANPQSGKDIRRFVTLASSFSNHEKVLILRRVLAGLAAAGVREALVYNDSGSLGEAALDGLGDLPRGVKLKGRLLSMTANRRREGYDPGGKCHGRARGLLHRGRGGGRNEPSRRKGMWE